jgi:hypothetical protein
MRSGDGVEMIGMNRYYEAMAFEAIRVGDYWEADVSAQLSFDPEWQVSEMTEISDRLADEMHERVVMWFEQEMWLQGYAVEPVENEHDHSIAYYAEQTGVREVGTFKTPTEAWAACLADRKHEDRSESEAEPPQTEHC